MNSILSFIEILDIKFKQITHDVIEHKERSCFLNRTFLSIVELVKDGSKHLVHSLHILSSRVDFGKNEQDSSHIVEFISFSMLFFVVIPSFHSLCIISMNNFPFLFSGHSEKGNHDRLCFCGKKGQF